MHFYVLEESFVSVNIKKALGNFTVILVAAEVEPQTSYFTDLFIMFYELGICLQKRF